MASVTIQADGVSLPMASDDEIALFSHPMKSPYGASMRAYHLFSEIEKQHGTEAARQIFQEQSSPSRAKRQRDWSILERLDRMPEPRPYTLARELAEQNRSLPADQRYGTGTLSIDAMQKHVQRLVRDRASAVKAGKWTGPGADDRGIAAAIVRVRVT